MRPTAHFYMPVVATRRTCAHNHTVDFALIREALRRARAAASIERAGVLRIGMTLNEAAAQSGLNRATIHSIENLKREPTLQPELETIERLARAYGLSLSAFFAQIDGSRASVAQEITKAEVGTVTASDTKALHKPLRGAHGEEHSVLRSAADSPEVNAAFLRELGSAIFHAGVIAAERSQRKTPAPPTRVARGGKGSRKTHR